MSDLGPKFYKKLLEMSNSLGMPPEHILNVMAIESDFNPSAYNPAGASGLIQFSAKTLKGVDYKGSLQDFRKEPAEEQLDYVEKLIRKNMNAFNGGKPFKSVTQYYVSNFIPAVLVRKDIKNEDPNAIIAEKDPKALHIPGKDLDYERKVYKLNSGLDYNKDGVISYKDLTDKLSSSSNRKSYKEQLNNLQKHTNYKSEIKPTSLKETTITSPKPTSSNSDFISYLENLINNLLKSIMASENRYKKIYKKFLPENNFVIEISSNDKINSIEFGRILCLALDEELLSKSFTHLDNDNVEVECNINGPKSLCEDTIKQLLNSLTSEFKSCTSKIGGVEIKTNISNKKSSYPQITIKSSLSNYRKFLLKFA